MSFRELFKRVDGWSELKSELDKPYFQSLNDFLENEQKNYTIFPKKDDIFNAYSLTPLESIKVVILGQDPYHNINQAHGLAFSVNDGVAYPPSLQNIFKELRDDLNCAIPKSGDLREWAKDGVFLLNSVLSVRASTPTSHKNIGWERFSDATIELISKTKEHIVFILWGSYAISKSKLIDKTKHLIITSPHPSPLSAYRGFFGSHPFSKANNYLIKHSKTPIKWCQND